MSHNSSEHASGDTSPPIASPREVLSDSELLDGHMLDEGEITEQDLANVDFSGDFMDTPGRTEFFKAMATKWSKNIVTKAGRGIDKVVKVQELKERMRSEPFLRAKDKLSFLVGVMMMLFTEFMVISYPTYLYLVYTVIFVPLIAWRFVSYHRQKQHYFMLDFCYFDNVLLLIWLYVYPNNLRLFKMVFALSTGPLLMAVFAWSNALVFHDLDRVTSLFIHVYPPLVLFAERWHNPSNFSDRYSLEELEWASASDTVWVPLLFYTLWQIAYLIKTEVIDRKRFDSDDGFVTSVRWLTRIRPHAAYRWLQKRGVSLHPNILLGAFQLSYTLVMLVPTMAFFRYKRVNELILILVLIFACWNGANFYFEIFSERYRNRLLKKTQPTGNDNKSEREKPSTFGVLPSSLKSFVKFSLWLAGLMTAVFFFIHGLC